MKEMEEIAEELLVANAKFEHDGLTHIEALELIENTAGKLEKLFPTIAEKVEARRCLGCGRYMGRNWKGGECKECRGETDG